MKPLITACLTLVIALIGAGAGALYLHEAEIVELDRDVADLRVKGYRQQIKHFEYRESYLSSNLQLITLKRNQGVNLSLVEQTRYEFYDRLLSQVRSDKGIFVEEHKHAASW